MLLTITQIAWHIVTRLQRIQMLDCINRKKQDETKPRITKVQLRKEYYEEQKNPRLLLLGTEACGKSTIMKQMKLQYSNGFSHEEKLQEIHAIQRNTLFVATSLIRVLESLDFEFDHELLDCIPRIKNANPSSVCNNRIFQEDVANDIYILWEDLEVKSIFEAHKLYTIDSDEYFLNNVMRIGERGYIPSDEDILRCRRRTIAPSQQIFDTKGKQKLKVFDIGGQLKLRRKWFYYFDDIDAILFVAAISDFDMVTEENLSRNRLEESLCVFKDVVDDFYLKEKHIILFLNKCDLFQEKLLKADLSRFPIFKNFYEEKNYTNCSNYIKKLFQSVSKSASRAISTHFTTAIDKNLMKTVLADVRNAIIETNARNNGLLM